MVNTKTLVKLARKWKRMAAVRRKRISIPNTTCEGTSDGCNTPPPSYVAPKGYFVVYSTDKQRLAIPISYLNNEIVRALFEKSEEEFGLSSDGHITLPVDSFILKYFISLISRGLAKEQENALLLFVASSSCPSSITSIVDKEIKRQPMQVCC